MNVMDVCGSIGKAAWGIIKFNFTGEVFNGCYSRKLEKQSRDKRSFL